MTQADQVSQLVNQHPFQGIVCCTRIIFSTVTPILIPVEYHTPIIVGVIPQRDITTRGGAPARTGKTRRRDTVPHDDNNAIRRIIPQGAIHALVLEAHTARPLPLGNRLFHQRDNRFRVDKRRMRRAGVIFPRNHLVPTPKRRTHTKIRLGSSLRPNGAGIRR